MTVDKFLEKMKALDSQMSGGRVKFSDSIISDTDIWSNDACLGYLMLAAEDIGLDKGTLSELVRAMKSAIADVSVSDAERKYTV